MLQSAAEGRPVEQLAFNQAVHEGVHDIVKQQVGAGLDVVNDGEMSKFSFASYHIERLEGFTIMELPAESLPAGVHPIAGEAADYPEFFERWAFNQGSGVTPGTTAVPVGPVCTGPIGYRDVAAVERDIANVLEAAEATGATEVFMSAVPPTGIAGGFDFNQYYSGVEEFDAAMADAMRAWSTRPSLTRASCYNSTATGVFYPGSGGLTPWTMSDEPSATTSRS